MDMMVLEKEEHGEVKLVQGVTPEELHTAQPRLRTKSPLAH
jgi:hypothetical protein